MFKWAAFFCVLLFAPIARADSWALPTPTTYEAADASARLSVTPRDVGSQLSYFEGRAQGVPPRGVLEVSDGAGGWRAAWDVALINEVAPVSALVASGGRYVVTFDNWHSVGRGENVVVIYDASGRVVRSLTLSDLLPAAYIEALPHSVSSTAWGGEHRFDGDGILLLQILVPTEDQRTRTYVDLPIELATGRVLTPENAAWTDAVAQAERVTAARRASRQRADAAFRAPLVAPVSSDEGDWYAYLREVFARLDRAPEFRHPATSVLRAPDHPDYSQSERNLCAKFHRGFGTLLVMASMGPPEAFIQAIGRCFEEPVNADYGEIYVVIPPQHNAAIIAALEPSGARIITIDPSVPVAQRPERIARREGRE